MIAIDIKMPVDCQSCFGRGAIWCRFDDSDRIVVPALPDESLEGRPDWCPLVEVPDYSDKKDDLIDALEKCGIVWSDKFEKVITVKELALFYGEKYETLQRKIERFSNDLVGDVREINKSDELFDRLKRNGVTSNKTPKIMVISPTGVAKIAYFSEGVKQHEVRQALSIINHRLHEELSVKYSDIYFSKVYQKEMSYLINNIFHSHKVENEKYVEGYRIDFLIDDHIAIECDESVHDYYNRDHEESRKKLMETKGYSFYRYDARKKNMLSFVGDLIDKEMCNPIGKCSEIPNSLDGEYDPRPDIYYLAEKIGIHRLYALVVQLRGEPESCIDTIGRQAAIDAVKSAVIKDEQQYAEDALKALPSAQPETDLQSTCNQLATDTISKTVAIDALKQQADTMSRWSERYDDLISRQAVKYLDLFTKTYCRDKSVEDDLVFRCGQCDFEMPDGKCLVKVMVRKLYQDYKNFGCMGTL